MKTCTKCNQVKASLKSGTYKNVEFKLLCIDCLEKFVKQNDKLTDEQVANWRKVLIHQFGAYALIMPVEQIQEYRDWIQSQTDKL